MKHCISPQQLLSCAAISYCSIVSAFTQQPHVIFIMSDQHRFDALRCMGNESIISPNIDALAADGTTFTNGYSSTPSSTPARAGLLTGMSPWHHGMLGYGKVAAKYPYEMPRMLSDLNYYTFGIGKMHWFPQKSLHGFDGTLVDESGRSESPDFISDYRLWLQTQAPGIDPDVTGIGWNDHAAGITQLPEHLHPTAWTGLMSREIIKNYDPHSKPLFLKVSFARPHSPYDPPQRWLDAYNDIDALSPWIGEWCKDKKYAHSVDPSTVATDAPFGNFGDDYVKNSRKHYNASVSFIDEEIGLIIAELKAKGMYDNSIICYTSDHGDMLGDHHHWRKTYPYEGSVHIPYIIKWPASYSATKGGKIDNPVELRDFLPTFIEAAGGQVPSDMDGQSLISLVEGNNRAWRKYIDLEHATCYNDNNYWCALTDGKLKYVWRFHTGEEELFDMAKDPHELRNIVDDKRYQKQLAELRQTMVSHLSERGEPYVIDGQLKALPKTILYSPMYPNSNQ